jgi:hypothetical protein
VQDVGGRAGAGESGGDLLADVEGLADAVTMILPPPARRGRSVSTAASKAPSSRARVRRSAAISTSKTAWAFSRWEVALMEEI